MNYLEWFAILNRRLSNDEHNLFVKKVSEAGLTDQIFKADPKLTENLLIDFLNGNYEIVPAKKDK